MRRSGLLGHAADDVHGFASIGEHGGQTVSAREPGAWRLSSTGQLLSLRRTAQPAAGVTIRRHRDNFPEAIDPRAYFTFNGFLTGPSLRRLSAGLSPEHAHQHRYLLAALPLQALMPWVQDDWRIHAGLTLELRLALGMERPSVESEDDSISPCLPGANGQAGDGARPEGLPRALAYDDYNNFAPRIGFAWNPKSLGGKTVFRGAYGIFYQRELANTWVDLAINDPFIRQTNINLDTSPSPFYFARYDLVAADGARSHIAAAGLRRRSQLARRHDPSVELQHSAVAWLWYGPAGRLCRQSRLRPPRARSPNQPAPDQDRSPARRPFRISARSTASIRAAMLITMGCRSRPKSATPTACSSSPATLTASVSATATPPSWASTSIQNGRDFHQQRGLCTQDFGSVSH